MKQTFLNDFNGRLAERVGFEPTVRGKANSRFRVGPVMTTSVPLRAHINFLVSTTVLLPLRGRGWDVLGPCGTSASPAHAGSPNQSRFRGKGSHPNTLYIASPPVMQWRRGWDSNPRSYFLPLVTTEFIIGFLTTFFKRSVK